MATYKVINEIQAGSGYIHDQSGNAVPVQSLVPQVGDIVEGTIEKTYIYNKWLRGLGLDIDLGPNTENRTKVFIQEEDLLKVSNVSSKKSVFIVLGSLIVVIALLSGAINLKKFKL